MTEEEFYKKKIFDKASIQYLRRQFPHLVKEIKVWYCSQRYNLIQSYKSFLMSKLNQMAEDEEDIAFTNEELYSLFIWWEKTPKKCYYCSLPENELETLHYQPGHINKRYPKRGKSLEIDRKKSDLPYTDINNLVLACYWCNNAKTDTFTEAEFIKLGELIKTIWEQRLNKKF